MRPYSADIMKAAAKYNTNVKSMGRRVHAVWETEDDRDESAGIEREEAIKRVHAVWETEDDRDESAGIEREEAIKYSGSKSYFK
ncbi:hypothetical protein V6N13_043045 [Hibiscus sabdariffa]